MWIINVLCLFYGTLFVWTNSVSADITNNTCGTDLEEFRRYYNPSETLMEGENICQNQNEDCTGIIDSSEYTNITLAESSSADCYKYFSVELDNPSSGNASLVLKESLSDTFDIDHKTSIQNCKMLYTCTNGNTEEHQVNFNILPENDNAPKFWENNTATVTISKQFTPGFDIEDFYPELHIIAEDIDYIGIYEERGDNFIECIVDKDPSDLINCSTTLVDDTKRGVYKFSLSLKKSIGAEVPNPYTFTLKTTDKGNPPLTGSNTQEVVINFEETDQFPPNIEKFYYTAKISNATWTSPETLVTIKASDGDVDINDAIIYTIVQEDSLADICEKGNDCFAIDRSTGNFSWNNKLSDTTIRSGLIEVLVKATEDNNGLRRNSITVVVIAIAGDDHPPKLDKETYAGIITKEGTMEDILFEVSDEDTALSSFFDPHLIGNPEHTDIFEIADSKLKLKSGFDINTTKLPPGGRVSFMLQVTDKNDTTKMDKSLVVITYPWNMKNPKFAYPSISGTVNNGETEVTLDKKLTAEDRDEIKSEIAYELLVTYGSEEFSLDQADTKDVKIKFKGDTSQYRRVTLVIKAYETNPSSESDARMDIATVTVAIGDTFATVEPTTPVPTTTAEPTTSTTTAITPTCPTCPTMEPCPTPEPCHTPEPCPTFQPITSEPTDGSTEPTNNPTDDPITSPTENPTPCPTFEPSPCPSVEPITCPTVEPTPCTTFEPISCPTVEPIDKTTVKPTPCPTIEPISCPTVEPTPCPTEEPINITTVAPITCPTVVPISCPTVEPCPATTPPPGDETVFFTSNDGDKDQQNVGYPNFVMLQNSVPMPITRVVAVSSNPVFNSQITYAVTDLPDSTKFHVDKSTGEMFLNNPKSQIYLEDLCPTSCSIKVTASLDTQLESKTAETTVTVTSLKESHLAVFSSDTSVEDAESVLNQINKNNTDVWFRLVNTQPLPTTKANQGSLLFLTARGTEGFMEKNEAASKIDMDGVDFTDDITIHHPSTPSSSNGGLVAAVIVLGVLLALIPLAALAFFAYKNKSAILSRLPARNSGQKMDKLADPNDGYSEVNYFNSNDLEREKIVTNNNINKNNINKPRMGQPALGSNTHGLMREMSTELEKRMETKQKQPVVYKNTMDSPKPSVDVSKPSGEARPLQFIKPPQKKKAPIVPVSVDPADQEDLGVRFNEKAEVMEVEKNVDKRSIARSMSSESSGSSVSSSSATKSDDEDVTVM